MGGYIPNEQLENQTVVRKYRELLQVVWPRTDAEERKQIRKAFKLATDAHYGVRRKSGEPYIYHPIAVAMICCSEMSLGATSVICALLHDVVEDTDYTLDDMRELFGDVVANIIDGLTKIDDLVVDNENISLQAENFKKIFLSMSKDVRVILIKLADRLHNMRTLDAMPPEKQLKIASETSYFYVPFAHRLGLYAIKSELEDYAMRYTNPTEYFSIAEKLKDSEQERATMIPEFIAPIQQALDKAGIKAEITSRTKSVSSIYNKMLRKQINFEDVYDIFAVRFVFDSPMYEEFDICWRIYHIICNLYQTNPSRDRNFLTHPKPNGYQSLHVTAMSKQGRWVEVQIRSKRMDEIAEKGLAAHYHYKDDGESADTDLNKRLEDWLLRTREILDSKDADALDFLSEVRLNLGLKEIYVFTPKGDMKTMPQGSTVLDFAYALHTNLGDHCIGAKVNYNITPVNKTLNNGDQVEIITSKKQFPKAEWLEFVQTPKARRSIKDFFRNEQQELISSGKLLLKQYFDELGVAFTEENVQQLMAASLEKSPEDFWSAVASKKLTKNKIAKLVSVKNAKELADFQQKVTQEIESKPLNQLIDEQMRVTPNAFLLDDDFDQIKYVLADCCNPIPGDTVVGFQVSDNRIVVHQTSCPNAISQMSRFGNRIIKTKWRKGQNIAFLSGIKLKGFDRKGIIKEMMDVVTSQMDLNIRSLNIESKNNVFTGTLMLYIQSVKTLNNLIEQLRQIDQMESVERIGYDIS
ncbi:MAG: bifunctional (p)ppGpp synthetase/guanosine-3',5'-bis(diphosphate) 3'-pyrophosphohydrolase [Prevotella sp.]|nr:bifunctional (p)ppGpp synthetase/guanosine-3',5'-bis(diphosphate) 3'-pyrophosphohydrolase [Prevotella sp.]MBR0527780.1 bifunctional (p)ppGpp synthetase/guanosine-3',5'-bis(diphosphate) 3'-pyrophosphohydrolase [Prevotella sp.]